MKRLLIIAALLISAYSFGQTIPGYTNISDRYNWLAGYLRALNLPTSTTAALQTGQTHQAGGIMYDSTGADSGLYIYSKAWQRMARAAELSDSAGNKITRVYRSNDSVYYCVYNNCTLAFIDSTGGSGGISDTSQYIGLRYGYGWNAAPFAGGFTDNTPVTTITTGSGHTIFAGGSFAAGNNVSLPYYIGSENWTAEQDIVCGTINNTSYGLSFNLTGSIGGTASLGGFFLLSDTMARVAYTATGLLPTYSDLNSRTTSNFIFTTGDTLHLKMQRKDKVVTTTMTNKVNGVSASVSADDQYCTVGLFSIGFYGGSWTFIDSLKITYQDVKYAQVAGIGNSIISGATADNVSTDWFNIATEGVTGGVVHMGAGFEQSLQGTYRMDDILNYEKPKTLLIEYGVNDLINSVNIDSFSARIQRIVVPAKAAGITPILTGIVPNAVNGTVYNDTLRAIASRNNIEFVDFFTVMKAPSATTINSIYGPGGGDPHPYQYGHSMMGRMVRDQVSYLWTALPALNFKNLPTVIAPKLYLAQDENGNIGKAYNSFQSDYIRNKYINNIIGDAESKNIAINGRAVFTGIGTAGINDFVVVGNSASLSNPNFKVSAGTTTASTLVAGTFSSGNFSVATTPILTGGNFVLQSNPVFMSSSPIVMMASNPGGNGITSEFTIDNNTSNLANATDEIQRWRKSGVTVAAIYRDGDFRTTKASGYTNNIHGTLSTYDFPTIAYGDSAWGGGGGSGADNANVGSGFRWLKPSSQNIKTAFAGYGVTIDSSTNTNGLTLFADTATLFPAVRSTIPAATGWTLSGNTGISAGHSTGNFLGTTDAKSLLFKTNGTLWAKIDSTTGRYSIYNRLLVGTATDDANFGLVVRPATDNNFDGVKVTSANESVNIKIGWAGIKTSSSFDLQAAGTFQAGSTTAANAYLYSNSSIGVTVTAANKVGIGSANTGPTALLHLPPGSASATTAPIKYTSGTVMSTIEAGAGEYNNAYYLSNNALNRFGLSGVVAASSSTVSNSGTSPTTLVTYTTKASTLAATNECLRGEIHGQLNDAAGTETLVLTFAGTNILSIAPAGLPTGFKIQFKIVRTGSSTATSVVDYFDDNEFHNSATFHLTGLTFTNTNAIVLTGTSSNSVTDAIVMELYRLYWEPAPNN